MKTMKYMLLDSQYCSMGRWIGIVLSHKLGIEFYDDKKLLQLIDEKLLKKSEVDELTTYLMETKQTFETLSEHALVKKVGKGMKQTVHLAIEKGPCIIHERANREDFPEAVAPLSVLIYNSSMKDKRKRALMDERYMTLANKPTDLEKIVHNEDKARALYKNAVGRKNAWGAKGNYDLCLNTAFLSREKCVDILIEAMHQ